MLTDSEWEKFFILLNKIVDSDGSFEEKKSATLEAAAENGAEMNLEEFAGWFVE